MRCCVSWRRAGSQGFECELRRRDGSSIWVSANVRAVRDEAGSVLFLEGTNEDISVMRVEVKRLSTLMQELLDYGKPVRTTAPTPGSIEAVVAEAVGSCAGFATLKQVKLASSAATPLPPIAMDRERLVRVFENLFQNAIQHTPAGGVVSVEMGTEDGRDSPFVVVSVKDSGPGFVPEDLTRVFEPFFSRRRGGTRLGLEPSASSRSTAGRWPPTTVPREGR